MALAPARSCVCPSKKAPRDLAWMNRASQIGLDVPWAGVRQAATEIVTGQTLPEGTLAATLSRDKIGMTATTA
jgi:hypothetical protein